MVTDLLREIAATPGCKVFPPTKESLTDIISSQMPSDLSEFYQHCGGVELFLGRPFGFRVVGSSELILANKAVFGSDYHLEHEAELEMDLTHCWYLIAVGAGREERISIDLGEKRKGYCYDSFWDRHGSGKIVAVSFTELLRRLIDAGGDVLYWETPNAPTYGFAR